MCVACPGHTASSVVKQGQIPDGDSGVHAHQSPLPLRSCTITFSECGNSEQKAGSNLKGEKQGT